MGGPNKADLFNQTPIVWENRSYSLAYSDGPYSMLLPKKYFERNPGLPCKNVPIGFQPEVGPYASVPSYEGLTRFMSTKEVEDGFPKRNGGSNLNIVSKAWRQHNFIPWTTGHYDHVYTYFDESYNVTGSEWSKAAQLASYLQNVYLCMGFISHIFEYTSAFVIWKTQSPWPTLRGFLYDWWLEMTGSFVGVKAVLHNSLSVTFDAVTWKIRIVNRESYSIRPTSGESVGVHFHWVTLEGKTAHSGNIYVTDSVSSMSSSFVGENYTLKFPENCSSVCFLSLTTVVQGRKDYSPTWLWLTDPTGGDESDFSQLGEARLRQRATVSLQMMKCSVLSAGFTQVEVKLKVPIESQEILFYPILSVYSGIGNYPLNPIFDSGDVGIVILPGESDERTLSLISNIKPGSTLIVVLSSWNAAEVKGQITCDATLGGISSNSPAPKRALSSSN